MINPYTTDILVQKFVLEALFVGYVGFVALSIPMSDSSDRYWRIW